MQPLTDVALVIVVSKYSPELQIAHGAAHQIGLIPLVSQSRHDFKRAVTDVLAGYTVLVSGDYIQA